MRSLTTKESNYINNLPLEQYQKQRIENVWGKCLEPVIGSEEEKNEKSVAKVKKNFTPNTWVLIPLLILQYYYPSEFWSVVIQGIGWIGVVAVTIIYYIGYNELKEDIRLSFMPLSLKHVYEPLPISIYINYIGQLAIIFLMHLCGYNYLAVFYAIVLFAGGLMANLVFTKHIKNFLNGGPDIDMKIHFLQEYSLKKKNKPEVDVYITVNDKKVL